MERLGVLINKLQEQFLQHTDTDKLIVTAQMLLAELERQKKLNNNITRSKVSVVMPGANRVNDIITTDITSSTSEHKQPEPKQSFETSQTSTTAHEVNAKPNNYFDKIFDPVKEVPTLMQQTKGKAELNDVIVNNEPSLNDKLKVQKTELVTQLKDEPIKDLRKAIGVNDRYLFINELFRGDETMYERSIKTINAFSILAEAEYWIQRELKLKLGWNEENETVHYFDQLVRRRFS